MAEAETTDIVIKVEKRKELGKEAAKKLRAAGRVPAVIYGGGAAPVTIMVEEERIRELLKGKAGENTIFLLKLKGTKEERRAMIKELQVDPLTREFVHIDFIRVVRGHALTVNVPVELVGDSVGVRGGGLVDFVTRELAIEVLPRDLPDKIVVDISELDLDQHISVCDLEDHLPESGKFLDDGQRVVVNISVPRGADVDEEEEELEEGVITEAAEPELIGGKGKDEEEESE